MFSDPLRQHLNEQLADVRVAGTFKSERVITSPQRAHISTTDRADVLNMCANNYLGLASHPEGRATRWRNGATAWRACASFAGRRHCTN